MSDIANPATEPPVSWCSPSLARCCADLALQFWEHACVVGAIDEAAPLRLIVLAGDDGETLWRLLNALEVRAGAGPWRLPPWRIEVWPIDAEAGARLRAHPWLAGLFEAQALALGGAPWCDEAEPAGGANPAVVLDFGRLAALPSVACSVAYGRIDYAGAPPASEWRPVADGYLALLNATGFGLPEEADARLARIAVAHGGRLLLCAVEAGVAELAALRCGEGDGALNLHALAARQAGRGARVRQAELADGRWLHLALFDGDGLLAGAFAGLAERAGRQADADQPALAGLLEAAPAGRLAAELPAWLALAGHDPALLARLPEGLADAVEAWTAPQLARWRQALDACWAHYFPTGANLALALRFADLAGAIEHWGLVRAALSVALDGCGAWPDGLAWLAACEAAAGRLAQARACLEEARALDPDLAGLRELAVRLAPRIAAQAALTAAARSSPERPELALEPLCDAHAAAFAWQFRDPQIALMVDLPALPDEAAVLAWLEQQQAEAGRRNFALMHADSGLVGEVSYVRDGDSAFIHFWIGCDHQGLGYAVPAVRMLAAQARADGVARLFTSAYADNARSLATLAGAGFMPLALPPLQAPDDELRFFALPLEAGAATPEAETLAQLAQLCAALDSPLALAAEACPA
ncbi:GNAT family N-acetyltransferase [Chitinimonas koreensis]|uniref:GNAT family N-acetyltransferase n=1 Tax=Chitinimonas koreensis TaxID=356302 RepID=UPI00042288EA|nr:GNAT family N-acetyltransferase [Chitinimonas koreensis]QNM95328.1 GNAT family N-acetyltransferase [Chitinimonas koreensis]